MEENLSQRVLSIGKNGVELTSSKVVQPVVTIGRSPTCDIILRARGVRPVHFLIEWYGGLPVGGANGKWSVIEVPEKKDLNSDDIEDFGLGKILSEKKNEFGGFDFQWKVDKLAPATFTGALTDSIEEHSQSIGYSDLLEILEVDLIRDSVCHVQHIDHFEDKQVYELRPDGPEITFMWVTGAPMVRGKVLFKSDEHLKVVKVGGKLNQMGSGEIHMSANDVVCATWNNYQYYLRFVAAQDLPEIKENPLHEPIYKFGGTLLAIVVIIVGLFMLIFEYKAPPPPRMHTRVAKIEIDKLIQPVIIEKKEVPKDFTEDSLGKDPNSEEKSEPIPLPEAKEANTPPVETPKKVQDAAPTPPPAPEPPPPTPEPPQPPTPLQPTEPPPEDIGAVGLLGALGGPSTEQVNISNQALLSETAEAEGAFNNEGVPFVKSGQVGKINPTTKFKNADLSKATTKINTKVDTNAYRGPISKRKGLSATGGKAFGVSPIATKVTSAFGVAGGLKKGQVSSTVNKHLAKMKKCYESALISKPDLQGKVTYFWVVAKTGKVESVRLKESEANHKQFEDCTLKVIEKIKFPKTGAPTEVVYPFIFK